MFQKHTIHLDSVQMISIQQIKAEPDLRSAAFCGDSITGNDEAWWSQNGVVSLVK